MPPASTVSLTLESECCIAFGSDLMWLFAIPDDATDGDGTVMLSAGNGSHELWMGRLDPRDTTLYGTVSWIRIYVNTSFSSGGDVCDHWHVYFHGEHWLTYSDTGAEFLGLFKTDAGLSNASAPGDVVVVTGYKGESCLVPGSYLTCDHFCVRGAPPQFHFYAFAVAVWDAGSYHFITLDSRDFSLVQAVESTICSNISNGGSATVVRPEHPYANPDLHITHILAPRSLDPSFQGDIVHYEMDFNGNISGGASIFWPNLPPRNHVSMPTLVHFLNGSYVITYKSIPGAIPILAPPDDDCGDIVRNIYDSYGNLLYTETVFASSATCAANRPHTSLYQDPDDLSFHLLTCWEEVDSIGMTHSGKLRMDSITFS